MWVDTGNDSAQPRGVREKRSVCRPKIECWPLASEFDLRSSRDPSVTRDACCAKLPVRFLLNGLEYLRDIPLQ